MAEEEDKGVSTYTGYGHKEVQTRMVCTSNIARMMKHFDRALGSMFTEVEKQRTGKDHYAEIAIDLLFDVWVAIGSDICTLSGPSEDKDPLWGKLGDQVARIHAEAVAERDAKRGGNDG